MGTEALWKVVVYIVEIIAWCIGPEMEIVKNSYSRVYTDLIHQSYVVFWVFLSRVHHKYYLSFRGGS